jgi:hypothetical protein
MSLTDVLDSVARALAADSTIESICQGVWGRSLTVHRRVGELYLPETGEAPMVQMTSRSRSRDGHYVIHTVTLAVIAGELTEPEWDGQIRYSPDEADAEALAERVEQVALTSLGDQGVAGEASEEAEDVLTGPYFIAAYNFRITLRNSIQ